MLCLQVEPAIPREPSWFQGAACLEIITKMEPLRIEYNFTSKSYNSKSYNSAYVLTDAFLV